MSEPQANPQPENSYPYDALLLISFGGPEGLDDVMPFLENVLRGRNVPRHRMLEVAHHYELFDGVSPLNGQNRALIAALETELAAKGPHLPIYWGNRNWEPFLTDTMHQMANDGVQKALAILTSAYSSYSSCRQYLEDIAAAQAAVGPQAPAVDKIRAFYNHPEFIAANVDILQQALEKIPAENRTGAHIAFTAHSIPLSMAQTSNYEAQLQETARLIAAGAEHDHWRLVYQSRSGPPHQPWLEPDVCDYMETLKAEGVTDLIIAPIGFLSDHMEIIYDLDTEAQELAAEIGLNMIRADTVSTHPTFLSMLMNLINERMTANPTRPSTGAYGPSHDFCPAGCCLAGYKPVLK